MMRFLLNLFTTNKQCDIQYVRAVIPRDEINEHQHTDVVLNIKGIPFITLTESKMHNTWYHDYLDCLFSLTARGFRVRKGSKKSLIKRGFGR